MLIFEPVLISFIIGIFVYIFSSENIVKIYFLIFLVILFLLKAINYSPSIIYEPFYFAILLSISIEYRQKELAFNIPKNLILGMVFLFFVLIWIFYLSNYRILGVVVIFILLFTYLLQNLIPKKSI